MRELHYTKPNTGKTSTLHLSAQKAHIFSVKSQKLSQEPGTQHLHFQHFETLTVLYQSIPCKKHLVNVYIDHTLQIPDRCEHASTRLPNCSTKNGLTYVQVAASKQQQQQQKLTFISARNMSRTHTEQKIRSLEKQQSLRYVHVSNAISCHGFIQRQYVRAQNI